ncbi:unnamed protein product [Boreogadus saida]
MHMKLLLPICIPGVLPADGKLCLSSRLHGCGRAGIDEVETDVVEIEAKLDKLVKLCSGMIEAGRAYVSANKLFVNGIKDLSLQCKKEEMISECLEKCGESLQEIVNYHTGPVNVCV